MSLVITPVRVSYHQRLADVQRLHQWKQLILDVRVMAESVSTEDDVKY